MATSGRGSPVTVSPSVVLPTFIRSFNGAAGFRRSNAQPATSRPSTKSTKPRRCLANSQVLSRCNVMHYSSKPGTVQTVESGRTLQRPEMGVSTLSVLTSAASCLIIGGDIAISFADRRSEFVGVVERGSQFKISPQRSSHKLQALKSAAVCAASSLARTTAIRLSEVLSV